MLPFEARAMRAATGKTRSARTEPSSGTRIFFTMRMLLFRLQLPALCLDGFFHTCPVIQTTEPIAVTSWPLLCAVMASSPEEMRCCFPTQSIWFHHHNRIMVRAFLVTNASQEV